MHWLLSGPLTVEKLTVKIADLPKSLQGTILVQMSDFHYDGLCLSEKMLTQAIALTNQVQPDLVVLTGDYVTDAIQPIHKLAAHLQHLESRYGVCAVLGNHDIYYKNSRPDITQALQQAGINVLWNQISYPLGTELPIVGLADFYSSDFQPEIVMNQLDFHVPRIVLAHNPDTASLLTQWRVDLQLSGHTHGGQIAIPGFGPVLTYYRKMIQKIPYKIKRHLPFLHRNYSGVRHCEWLQGLHHIGKNQLYVNRGLGTYPPGRFFCSPELTIITLAHQ
jgi:predicted MPP superfamily phosphohydrolase